MKTNITAVTAVLALTCLSTAQAGPAGYVHTPAVEYGEKEIELHAGSARDPGEERESAAVISFGYGVSQRWFTEIGAEIEKQSGEGAEVEALEWENVLQLTEPGQYAVDLGLLVELELSLEDESGELKVGPLLQTEFGKTQVNFNPLLERKFDTDGDEKTELVYEWQLLYRLQQSLEFGLQGLGEVGEWNDWQASSQQSHKAGPVIAGKLPLGNQDTIKYEAACCSDSPTPPPITRCASASNTSSNPSAYRPHVGPPPTPTQMAASWPSQVGNQASDSCHSIL